MLKMALFAAATIYLAPAPPQSGCAINGYGANPELHVKRSSQGKPERAKAGDVEVKMSNGAYWTQLKVCKRQTA